MDIKELNKTQLILLTLLITFVVSIATGIITVSIMQQMPKSVPQTINNVIQRTIEKVTTTPAPTTTVVTPSDDSKGLLTTVGDGDVVVPIYSLDTVTTPSTDGSTTPSEEPKALGQGIIISDIGLILVDSNILTEKDMYKVVLNKIDFDASVLKKFSNGFTILKVSAKKESDAKTDTKTTSGEGTTKVDNKP